LVRRIVSYCSMLSPDAIRSKIVGSSSRSAGVRIDAGWPIASSERHP
jgi:hypothetical protein